MKDFIPVLKDRLILTGWIAGLVLAACVLWILTFSFRAGILMNSTNKILAQMEDDRLLSAPLQQSSGGSVPLGCWYKLNKTDNIFFVFAVIHDGILVPFGAEISEKGKAISLTPLGNHARQVMNRIPQGVLNVYMQRIESAAESVLGDG